MTDFPLKPDDLTQRVSKLEARLSQAESAIKLHDGLFRLKADETQSLQS